ncbi:hypothetical protein [Mangrovicoccus sp. HB161399]|uniref:hypothetical protein n=1 Tax=Mangrovicoccus sp. HB161399 TaxID=2720392 RepID=UPI0015561CB0|nr:hypothetical protein [Mangrovicoccus sp. HB161399]
MPRPKTPLRKARLTGADKAHPERFRGRSEPAVREDPVGDPPAYLPPDAKAVWAECSENLPWLVRADRQALEAASVAIGQVRMLAKAGELVPASMLSAANTAIGKLGASPTDRSKVWQKPDEDDADPFAQFMN